MESTSPQPSPHREGDFPPRNGKSHKSTLLGEIEEEDGVDSMRASLINGGGTACGGGFVPHCASPRQ